MIRIRTILTTLLTAVAATSAMAAPQQPAIPDSLVAEPPAALPDSASRPAPKRPKVTPVDVDDNKPPVVMHYYDKHGEPLKEPVMFLAALDTVAKPKSKPVYPLYNGMSVGVNFGDAVMMAIGDRFGSFDIHADVSLHNWFFPVVEAGIGFADATPKKNNFTYRVSPSFYTKAGLDYNFLYKSDPAYRLFLGLRAGFSSFRYSVEGVSISDDYWGETQPDQKVGPLSCMVGRGTCRHQGKDCRRILTGLDATLQISVQRHASAGVGTMVHTRLRRKSLRIHPLGRLDVRRP